MLKLQYFSHKLRAWKELDAGKDWRQEEKWMTEDELVGWHHWLKGHEFDQTPGDSEGQGSLARCSPSGHKQSDMTQQLNNYSSKQSTVSMQSLSKSQWYFFFVEIEKAILKFIENLKGSWIDKIIDKMKKATGLTLLNFNMPYKGLVIKIMW